MTLETTAARYELLDPTAETSAVQRDRTPPLEDLRGARIGLVSISKERSDEFVDHLEDLLVDRGLEVERFRKPTHTKPAPEALVQDVAERCDVVIQALAD